MSDGVVEQTGENVSFRYERRFSRPIEDVWTEITDPDAIERWMGSRPEIEPRPGGRYLTRHGEMEVVDRVVRFEPPEVFEHTFWLEFNPGALVTWTLHRVDGGARLELVHSLAMDDVRAAAASIVAGDGPSLILARNGAGWHRLLDKIEAELDGRVTAWTPEDQQALQERYAEQVARLPR